MSNSTSFVFKLATTFHFSGILQKKTVFAHVKNLTAYNYQSYKKIILDHNIVTRSNLLEIFVRKYNGEQFSIRISSS